MKHVDVKIQSRIDSYIIIAKHSYPLLSGEEIADIIDKGNEMLRFNSKKERELFIKQWDNNR